MIFYFVFAINTILPCFFHFFLIIDLYFLIPTIIPKIFNPTAKLVFPIRTPTKEAKAEIKTHPVTAEAQISKFSI